MIMINGIPCMCMRAHIYNLFNRKKGGKLPQVSEKNVCCDNKY